METNCRFANCQWTGTTENLFDHCQAEHKEFIIQINDENGFNFLISDIMEDTFLLVSLTGLYWFLLDPAVLLDRIRRGVFAIGKSEVCEYTMKIGRTGDGSITYMGPNQVRPDGSGQYDLMWSFDELKLMKDDAPTRSMQLFFGPYSDFEVSTGTCEEVPHKDNDLADAVNLPEGDQIDLQNDTCLVCLSDNLPEGSCPVCTTDISTDFMNPDDDELLLLSCSHFRWQAMLYKF